MQCVMLLSQYFHYELEEMNSTCVKEVLGSIFEALKLGFEDCDISYSDVVKNLQDKENCPDNGNATDDIVDDWDQLSNIESAEDIIDNQDIKYMWLHMRLSKNLLHIETVWIRYLSGRLVIKLSFRNIVEPEDLENFRKEAIESSIGKYENVKTIALALSGGGFRATLFHIGVIYFLRQSGRLKDVTHITSVSGGSILAAHMVMNWDRYNVSCSKDGKSGDEIFKEVVLEVCNLSRLGVRNRIHLNRLLYSPIIFIVRIFQKILPFVGSIFNFIHDLFTGNKDYGYRKCFYEHVAWGSRTYWLAKIYDKFLFKESILDDLGQARTKSIEAHPPQISILSTSLSSGDICTFNSDGIVFENSADPYSTETIHAKHIPVSIAVSASSAFPPIFDPVKVVKDDHGLMECDQVDYLSDGGIFDNLGLRRIAWLFAKNRKKNTRDFIKKLYSSEIGGRDEDVYRFADQSIISDAGAIFKIRNKDFWSMMQLGVRASDIMMRRVSDMEPEISIKQLQSRYGVEALLIPISKSLKSKKDLSVHAAFQGFIKSMRTDLDEFTEIEISALLRHGYSVARSCFVSLNKDETNPNQNSFTADIKELRKKTAISWDPYDQESITHGSCIDKVWLMKSSKDRSYVFRRCLFKTVEFYLVCAFGIIIAALILAYLL